ncbi:MAG: S8 family serine peptidase, partial [Candidatus Dormibacteraeota bacterium]|nr:S8 family serine peptidase [Candidatus Dormibacteraeota bacterium]
MSVFDMRHCATGVWRAALLLAAGGALAVPVTASAAPTGPLTNVIVRGDGSASPRPIEADVTAYGGHVLQMVEILDGAIASVPANEVGALQNAPGVAEVTSDSQLTLSSIGGYDPTTDVGSLYSTEQITGVQRAWRNGATGQGVGVALIDTGVSPVQGLNGSGQVINGPDISFASQAPALTYLDEYGHGTHMAGIIAGNDSYGAGTTYAGNSNQFTGVAPDAHILNVKVADEHGVVDVSQVIAALDWVVQHKNDNGMNIRVINLSFGTDSTQAYTLDPLAFAAEVAWRKGLVVVAAAGNAGNGANGLNDPAIDPYLIAVGAVDTNGSKDPRQQSVASFSSSGDGNRNPDLVAPGVHIASLRDPGSVIDQQYGQTATVSSNARFFRGSGTSQATAEVSGAAADLLSAHSGYTPDQVKYALTSTATSLGSSASLQGSGELNLAAALTTNTPPGHYRQRFEQSTGTGTLEGSRGSGHIVSNNVVLSGEQDIFGSAFDSASMAQAEADGVAWSGGTWNGVGWSGVGWSGVGWSGVGWSGVAWSGVGWSGVGWSGATWNGVGWSGVGWSGVGWSGVGWSG